MHRRDRLCAVVGFMVLLGFGWGGCRPASAPDPGPVPTGKVRLLVTDRPFPVDLLASAKVTITRVEVHRAHECEDECDDGQFCNGAESCDSGVCSAGTAPCAAGQACDEQTRTCLTPCTTDADCDDAAYCNGVEVCAEGFCTGGAEPCGDDFDCDETAQQCVAETESENEADDSDDDLVDADSTASAKTDDVEAQDAAEADKPHGSMDDAHDEVENEDDDGAYESPWLVVFEGEKEFDLLDLRNGRTDLLADVDIPAGTYTQMRLIVTKGEVVLVDGRTFPLRVPSGEQTGVKLHLTFEVNADEETQLLLDVDLSRAFSPIPAGHMDDPSTIRSFRFSPSVAMRLINLLEAGSISGHATTGADDTEAPLPGVHVAAFVGDTEVTSTTTETDGSYVLGGLTTGQYRVVFSADSYDDLGVESVPVSAGSATEGVDALMSLTVDDTASDPASGEPTE